MEKSYKDFVDRMGSFEDTLDISGENLKHSDDLTHFGILGMKWGHHKAVNATTLGAAARTGKEAANLGQNINKASYSKNTLKEYYRDWETDRKSTRLNSSHSAKSRMPSSA